MTRHIVQQGECLSTIASRYGFSRCEAIYNHPANAAFKEKRPDPNVIFPGETLFIPDREKQEELCSTEQRHRFRKRTPPAFLCLRMENSAGHPLPAARYQLVIENRVIKGTTTDQGWIKERVPGEARSAMLILWPDPSYFEYTIKREIHLGYLDPIETTPGVKARLRNLGYDCGEINDVQDGKYDAAVRKFQCDQGLPEDSMVSQQMRDHLKQRHSI